MTTTTNAINVQNFNAVLEDVISGLQSRRDTLQALLVFGFNFYAGNIDANKKGDTVYLMKTFNSTYKVKGLRTSTMKNYIEAVANVVASKGDDNNPFILKKKGKGEAVINAEIMAAKTWYDFDKEGEAKVFKPVNQAQAVRNRLAKIMAGDGETQVDADQAAEMQELATALDMYLNAAKLRKAESDAAKLASNDAVADAQAGADTAQTVETAPASTATSAGLVLAQQLGMTA